MEITEDLQRQIDEYESNPQTPMSNELRQYYDAKMKARQNRLNEEKRLRDELEEKKAKVAGAIHQLIVENNLSVHDAITILKDAVRRVEICSQVTTIDWNKLTGCMSFLNQ